MRVGTEVALPLPAAEARRRWLEELVSRAVSIRHVRTLRELEREEGPAELRRVLLWSLALEIPAFVRPFVPRDALVLHLEERWSVDGCAWRLRSAGVPEAAAHARGSLVLSAAGEGSLLRMTGVVAADPAAIPGLPPLLAQAAGPQLVRGAGHAVERSYQHLAAAIAR